MHTGRLSQQHSLAELHEVLPDRVIDSGLGLPVLPPIGPGMRLLAVSLDGTISSVHGVSGVKYYELPIQLGKPCGSPTKRSNTRWIP